MRRIPRLQRWLASALTVLMASGSLSGQLWTASEEAIGPQAPGHLALQAVRPLCDGALVLTGDGDLYESLQGLSTVRLDLPLPDGSLVSLHLQRRTVLAPGARIVVGFADGDLEVDAPFAHFFAGDVAGAAESLVVLGVTEDGIQGFLTFKGDTYSLSTGRYGSGLPLVVSSLADLPDDAIAWAPFECGVNASMLPPASLGETLGDGPRSDSTCRIVEVALDTDWEFTERFGGDTDASTAYALLLMTANAEIYSRDFNIGLQVSYLRVWADANDPWDQGNMGDQLTQFRDYWQANMQDVDRHLAHYLSTRNLGGGVAWVSVICNAPWSYSLAGNLAGYFPYPLVDHSSQNWDIFVTAHELGHNCGAPHTHDLDPPADGCGLGDCSNAYGGTIMSYCHGCSGGMRNIVLNFHERIIDEKVLPYLRRQTCMEELGTPLFLAQPQSAAVCPGLPVVFVANVSSSHPITYQWWKDGVELPGETGSQLVILEASVDDVGAYSLAVSNGCETVFSDEATLSIDTLLGDLTLDGWVNQDDLGFLLAYYEHSDGGDIDGDGDTDQSDLGLLLMNYGQTCQ
ncbi:MAG: M12 family metallo-peptidase [Phycisphaerales bacterium JB038]